MSTQENLPEVVKKIDNIELNGNVIPKSWYKHIKRKSGPYRLAIDILGELVYWHRISKNGQAKFSSDKLQKSYDQLMETFCESKDKIRAACKFLKGNNLITMELRDIKVNGRALNNVHYMEPVADEITKITYSLNSENNRPSLEILGESHSEIPDTNTQTNANIKFTTSATQELTPEPQIKIHKFNNWFKIPNKFIEHFHNHEHLEFLNKSDDQILVELRHFFEDDEKREYLRADIDTVFDLGKSEPLSHALRKKLINIDFILDKFSFEQYLNAYDIAYKRGNHDKISYVRKVLEKAYTPLLYKQSRAV